ncbi:AmmeMemoRadiSam system protein A [Vibrio albus]|jgi:AmmeMemoRadiSam system protein A|uniref:AmmeMemoRadiSam system protein A n=1 Tax=Vibrio albus TaxID=2200953 RepID=A0A2U3BBA2_9VIBR|nr:AmmeMemoRadiSam system protein A [Vibrio albus]PWI34076.1 AmmeMemoRadiSam system protein A [Vibrio albus]
MSAISSQPYSDKELEDLLNIANRGISDYLREIYEAPDPSQYSENLKENGACFVTLEVSGQLQGCLGIIEPERPLLYEVYNKAQAASSRDPRFSPLEAYQLADLTIEVSVLSKPVPLDVASEHELEEYLSHNRLGVILSDDTHRALFLPQVWEQLHAPREFLYHLKKKAGWSGSYWSPSITIQTFRVISIKGAYKP